MDVTSAFDKRTNQGKCLCVLGSTNADLEHHESQELYLNLFLLIGLMRSLGHNQVITGLQDGIERQTAFQLVQSATVFSKSGPLRLSFYRSDVAINREIEQAELETAIQYGEQLALDPSRLQGVTHWLLIGITVPQFLKGRNVLRLSTTQLQLLPDDTKDEIIKWAGARGWVGKRQ